ncbi:hypothetical protein D4764_16G0007790 [Takifugu flavidus]|uniref:Uncharacterized protein n=1 Tax=Takifugu flavidus TaxID=433684 RepID=A0A5C6NXR8_9TELE|nr:hypothetical protein D4764_16G0007790 [Takifugu flavidus]
MFCRLQRLTPGYIRLLQTQAYHNVPVTPPADKSVPGMAVLLGAVGIGMCGYSSRQLALHHRPSAACCSWSALTPTPARQARQLTGPPSWTPLVGPAPARRSRLPPLWDRRFLRNNPECCM